MTKTGGIGLAIIYHFRDDRTLLMRVSDLFSDHRQVLEYMTRLYGPVTHVSEPGPEITQRETR